MKKYLYNAIDYMLQAGESEQSICKYIGMSEEELIDFLDNYNLGE